MAVLVRKIIIIIYYTLSCYRISC